MLIFESETQAAVEWLFFDEFKETGKYFISSET